MPAAPPEPEILVLPRRGRLEDLRLDLRARGGIDQPLHHRVSTTLACPNRQTGVQGIAAGDIGVLIGGNVEALLPRLLEPLQHHGHATPILLVGRLQVMNRRGHVRLARDAEHLVEAGVDLVGLGSLVRDVAAAEAARDPGQPNQLLGPGEAVGHVLERCREAERPGLHCVGHLSLHFLELGWGRGAIFTTDDRVAHAARADERTEVDGGRLAIEHAQVAGEVVPTRHLLPVEHRGERVEAPCIRMGCAAETGFAGQLGRDPLHDLARHPVVPEHPVLRLAEHVDEARSHDEPARVDAAPGRRRHLASDRGDALADDAHVSGEPWRTGAVHDAAARDQQVATGRRLPGRWGKRSDEHQQTGEDKA